MLVLLQPDTEVFISLVIQLQVGAKLGNMGLLPGLERKTKSQCRNAVLRWKMLR